MRSALLCLPVAAAAAETAPAPPVPAPPPPAAVAAPPSLTANAMVQPAVAPTLPPMAFNGYVAGDEIYDLLRAAPLLAGLSKDLPGSPIVLRVTRSLLPTAGGKAAGLASAIFTGGTLGLIPMVLNNDLVITYEVLVNGTVVSSHVYQKNFTRTVNIYGNDTTYGLGKEGLAWVRDTASQFVAAAGQDAQLAQLAAEYRQYFGPAAVNGH
ncbi:MAG: hypothetical protein U1F30_03575 [Steroidobacteraceae bacterium]